MTTDLWLMVALVVALLVGNLWLLKRNSKQQIKRNVSKPSQQTQAAAAVQTSPVLTTTDSKAADTKASAADKPAPEHSSSATHSDADGGGD